MNWKSEAIEKLKEYPLRKNAVTSIPEEIKRLQEAAYRIRSALADATPASGGSNGRVDMLLSNIARRQELKWRLDDAQRWVQIVEAGLAVLSAEERRVLEVMYMIRARGDIDRLCKELHLEDERSVYKRKDVALRKFTLALYGICEK